MPRVFNTGSNVDEWYHSNSGEGSSTHDVCRFCYVKLEKNPMCFNNKLQPYQNDEPQGDEGWMGDVEHPPYDECDYTCEVCDRRLTEKDD